MATIAKNLRDLIFGSLETKYKAIKNQLNEPSDKDIKKVFSSIMIVESDSDPAEKPEFVGQIFINTDSKDVFIGIGINSEDDWVKIS